MRDKKANGKAICVKTDRFSDAKISNELSKARVY